MANNMGWFRRLTSGQGFKLAVIILLALALVGVAVVGFRVLAGDVLPTLVPTVPAAPTIALAPDEAEAGTLVAVTGSGWPAGSTVLVRLEQAAGAAVASDALASATVAADGTFSTTLVFPTDEEWARLPGVLVIAWNPAQLDREARAVLAVLSEPAETPAAETPLPEPTETPTPTQEPGEQPGGGTPTPGPVVLRDEAAFLRDVTIPDGTRITAGQAFVKTWRVRNDGTSTWGAGYTLTFLRGDRLARASGDAAAVALPGPVAPGQTVDISVELAAPARDGSYSGYWQLRDAQGAAFDDNFTIWVRIVVGNLPTPTPTPAPITGWRGEYFGNRNLSGAPALVRDDAAVNFDWLTGAPSSILPADNFSARWTRTLSFAAGTYRFYLRGDDGMRLWLDGELIMDQWHDALAQTYVAERTLSAGNHALRVEFYESLGAARIALWWEPVNAFPQWRGEYYNGTALSGAPLVVRNDAAVDFDWSLGSPAQGVPADSFSVRWTRVMSFDDALYRFHILVDDGVRLFVDDALVIDNWKDGALRELTAERRLIAGAHTLRVEYYEHLGDAEVHLWWEKVASYPDWKGEYWSNPSFSGNPVLARNDVTLDFAWGSGSPAAGVPADNFSARWSRTRSFDAGLYRFSVRADDGVRLYVDGERVINEWHANDGSQTYTVDLPLKSSHTLRVDYYEGLGQALVKVSWTRIGDYPPTNGAPDADNDTATAEHNAPVTLNVLANDSDPDGDALSVSKFDAASAQGGTVSITAAGLATYTPKAGFSGTDTFNYTASDGRGGTDSAKVTVTVKAAPPANREPDAHGDSASTAFNTPVTLNVLANDSDPDGDALSVLSFDAASAQGGTVSITAAGLATYTPKAGFSGTDTFRYYTASDGRGGTNRAKVTVTVGAPPENHAPDAVNDRRTTDEGQALTLNVLANDSDPDKDALSVVSFDVLSEHLGLVFCSADGACSYTPALGFSGDDEFRYTISDGRGGQDRARVRIDVRAKSVENLAPRARDDEATLVITPTGDLLDTTSPITAVRSLTLNVLANDSDPDGDPLAVTPLIGLSEQGGWVQCTTTGLCTYTPALGFLGEDKYAYTISDGRGGRDGAEVTVMVVTATEN